MLRHISRKFAIRAHHLRTLFGVMKHLPSESSFHSSARTLFAALDKDLPTPTQLTSIEKLYSHDTDVLLEQLRKAASVERVLELVSMHLDVMNDNHIVTCFNVLHDRIRVTDGVLSEANLCDEPVFQSLCTRVMNRSKYLDVDGLINICKTLTKLNVPCNTYVMQSILKTLSLHVNDLDLKQLTFLSFLMSKQKSNPLVDGLLLALPLVLQVQVDQQLDSSNVTETVNCLQMACRSKLKMAIIEKIVSCLRNKVEEFTADQACSTIFSLLSLDTPIDGYMELIKASFDVLIANIKEAPSNSLLSLTRLCAKHSFYYRSFFMCLCNRAVSESWGLSESFELTKRLQKLNFFSPELLDVLAKEICLNVSKVRRESKYSPLSLSECFTFVDYQPKNITDVLDIISSLNDKLDTLWKAGPHLYLKTVSCWAMIGYFSKNNLDRILNEEFLYSSWSFSKRYGRASEFELYVCCLYWALEIYGQAHKFVVPFEFLKKIFQSVHQRQLKLSEFPLTKFLENGLGGSQFFLNNISTRNGHLIDHVLAMRSGNYPVSMSHVIEKSRVGLQTFVDAIRIPDDAKMIAIVVASSNHYCTDPEILKGYMALKLKSLLKMNLCPVVVNYENWVNLPDREKIPFLMRQIKETSETENFTKSSFLPL